MQRKDPDMEARHAEGKALWQKHMLPRFMSDAESGLNRILDSLEDTPGRIMAEVIFEYFYGENEYADAPLRIGNDEYGITVRNRVGLAPGFTKDGRGIEALSRTGFGLIGVGTNPWHPQLGNLPPRFFVECRAEDLLIVVNRFGFNSSNGILGPVRRVENIWRERGRESVKSSLVWSVGPNKSTLDEYEETRNLRLIARDIVCAIAEIVYVMRPNDVVAFNVTSPNTPGLRRLLDMLEELLGLIFEDLSDITRIFGVRVPPCVIKLSPDMPREQMRHVARAAARHKPIIALEGFNTTVDEDIRARYGITEPGGISGDPLRELAHDKLITLCEILDGEGIAMDVMGIGGIIKPLHALARLAVSERVKTVQILSGIFTEGLTLPSEILEAFATHL